MYGAGLPWAALSDLLVSLPSLFNLGPVPSLGCAQGCDGSSGVPSGLHPRLGFVVLIAPASAPRAVFAL